MQVSHSALLYLEIKLGSLWTGLDEAMLNILRKFDFKQLNFLHKNLENLVKFLNRFLLYTFIKERRSLF